MNSMMLVVAISAGQGPGGGYPPPQAYPYPYPVVRTQAGRMPPAVQPNGVPMPMIGQPGMGTPMPMQTMPPTTNGTGNGNGNGNGECNPCEPEEEAPAPPVYLLERTLRETWLGKKMADCNIKLYGWTAMSYTLSTTSVSNLPMTFNDQPNHFQMNQNWIHFEKAIDTSKDEFQWGLVTEWIVPGTDARFSQARGLFNGQTGEYQFDLYQAYTQAFLPNLGGKGTTVWLGRFATHCGYELVQAPLTPFVSKSYLFQYNPFTHSGVWATTQLNDTWALGYGAAVGSDNFFGDPTNRFMGLGRIAWTPKDRKISALFNLVLTDPTFITNEAFARYNVYNAVVTYNVNDCLTYVLDASYSHMDGVPGVSGAATWYGASNYFIYKWCDKLATTLRAEVFEDTDGVRTGFSGLYTEATLGFAWSPKPGIIIRPSVRYDYNADSTPFEGDSSMWTAAFETIFRW